MATRAKGKAAAKTATKPKKAAAKAATKEEKTSRLVGYALMDTKSAEFKALTERRQAWIERWADIAPRMKNVHRILEHNKGLFWIFTTDGHYQVGKMSDSGKSFVVEFDSESRDDSYEYYVEHRTGNYGKDAAPEPKTPKAKASKAPKAAKPKARKKSKPAVDLDDDLEDMLD